jgi:hypothetical protein
VEDADRRPAATSHALGDTANPIVVRMMDTIAAQKPLALNPLMLRSKLIAEKKIANGKNNTPSVKMARIANTHPNIPDINPADDARL